MKHGYTLFRLFDIDINIDPSWLLVFLLVVVNLSLGILPQYHPDWNVYAYWAVGTVASFLFFASILAHELAHSLVARWRGLTIRGITLFLFGGVADISSEPDTPQTEFLMTIVGPVTSIVLGILCFFSAALLNQNISYDAVFPGINSGTGAATTLLLWLGQINIVVGLFNLIPGFPLDGGRILRSVIWRITANFEVASRAAVSMGQLTGIGWICAGAAMILGVSFPVVGSGLGNGIWLMFIGWFILNAANQSYRQTMMSHALSRVSVRDVMRKEVPVVSPDTPIRDVVDAYFLGSDTSMVPVMSDHVAEGAVYIEDVQKIPSQQWQRQSVRDVMTPVDEIGTVSPRTQLSDTLPVFAQKDAEQVLVVKDGTFVGMLSYRDVLLWMSMHTDASQKYIASEFFKPSYSS